MARMRQPVDAFFDGVLVMDKDEGIRKNRLALLREVFSLFLQVADFSKIVTETGSMG
jgi:glycyl-tRNA synthetase beta chain